VFVDPDKPVHGGMQPTALDYDRFGISEMGLHLV